MAAVSVGGLIYASPYRNCSFGCAKGKKIITGETQTCQILIEKGCKWNFDSFTIIDHIPMPNSRAHFLETTEKKQLWGFFPTFAPKTLVVVVVVLCVFLLQRGPEKFLCPWNSFSHLIWYHLEWQSSKRWRWWDIWTLQKRSQVASHNLKLTLARCSWRRLLLKLNNPLKERWSFSTVRDQGRRTIFEQGVDRKNWFYKFVTISLTKAGW